MDPIARFLLRSYQEVSLSQVSIIPRFQNFDQELLRLFYSKNNSIAGSSRAFSFSVDRDLLQKFKIAGIRFCKIIFVLGILRTYPSGFRSCSSEMRSDVQGLFRGFQCKISEVSGVSVFISVVLDLILVIFR